MRMPTKIRIIRLCANPLQSSGTRADLGFYVGECDKVVWFGAAEA